MRPALPPILLAVALASAVGFARPARAGVPAPTVPAAELRAGEVVEVRWSALPPDAREMELLLSVDGGRTWPLRVSAELDPRERSLRWRVPNLAASGARLRLRCGDAEREVEGPASAAFAIVADPARPRDRFRFHEGTWWESDMDPAGVPVAGALAAPGLAAGARRPAEATTSPRHDEPAVADDARPADVGSATERASRTPPGRRPRPARSMPMRS
jgi:hypothetical protein